MKISVIIPVYNAERFLAEAVESALMQEETGEVILVEDGSPDNALSVCRELAQKYDRVKLFQHPDKGNHGAGASRNLGIQSATCDYIAFLDADDYMLSNRFKRTKEVFEAKPDAEGVYEAVGIDFQDDEVKRRWFSFRSNSVTTVKRVLEPSELFTELIKGTSGIFCTGGIVYKKNSIKKIGHFNTSLKLSQDTHFYFKSAALCNLYPGDLVNVVSMRRVHSFNRSNRSVEDFEYWDSLMWNYLFDDLYNKNISDKNKKLLYSVVYSKWKKKQKSIRLAGIKFLIRSTFWLPFFIFQPVYWKIWNDLIESKKIELLKKAKLYV